MIIGQISASDKRSLQFNALAGVILCEYADKLYVSKN